MTPGASGESPGVRWACRLHRLLLFAYPPGFRRREGEEMARLFRDQARAARGGPGAGGAGGRSLTGLVVGAAVDVLITAAAEWVALARRDPRDRRTGRSGAQGASVSTERLDRGEGSMMGSLGKDVKWALRTLRRSPGVTGAAVLTIALGVGAITAIFSVTRAVLLEPLPYAEPDELVLIDVELRARDVTGMPFSPPDFRDMREMTPSLEDAAGAVTFEQPLTGEGEPVQVMAGGVTTNFFEVLGVRPLLGRTFRPEDGEPGAPGAGRGSPATATSMAILDAGLWRTRFGGDPDVLGRVVDLGGGPAEIVGVAPEGFELLFPPGSSLARDVDVWVAMRLDYGALPRGNLFISAFGRMNDDATVARLQDDLDRVAAHLRDVYPGWATSDLQLNARPMRDALTADVRPVILSLVAAVVFVLLIACANVSNLLLVRATARQREISIRGAMGGSRRRIARQLLTESFAIAAAGAVLGAFLAWLGIDLLLLLRPDELPRLDDVGMDGAVLTFSVAAAGFAALVFGTLPAIQGSRINLADALRDRGHSAVASSQRFLRNAVVVAEVALSLVLLVGAGLMVRSFIELQRVDPGFEPTGAVTFGLNLPQGRYPDLNDRLQLAASLQERLGGLPGVEAVAAAFPLPLDPPMFNGRWGREEDVDDPESYRQADYFAVSTGYFDAMGTSLLDGRDFTRADEADSLAVVVVNRTLAERAFPGESALGKRLHVRVSSQDPQIVEVIGVVEHQRHPSLVAEPRAAVYFTRRFTGGIGLMNWVLRSDLDVASLASAARREVAELDPLLPVDDIEPLGQRVERAMASSRFVLVLMSVFGGLSVVLAAIGLYGVVAFTVRQRTAEFGLRMVLGAERGSILRRVVGQGLAVAGLGIVVGLLVAAAGGGLMQSLLVGVEARDPVTFGAVSAGFLLVAAAASLIPALRATRVDPSEALRSE